MDVSHYLQGAFLKASDLDSGDIVTTISGVREAQIGDDTKLVLVTEKGDLVLNKTNLGVIVEAYGSNTDGWMDRRIKMTAETTHFQGKRVPCIRVKTPKETRPAAKPKPETRPAADESEIPF